MTNDQDDGRWVADFERVHEMLTQFLPASSRTMNDSMLFAGEHSLAIQLVLEVLEERGTALPADVVRAIDELADKYPGLDTDEFREIAHCQ